MSISTFSNAWITKLRAMLGSQIARYNTSAGQTLADNVVSGPIDFGTVVKDDYSLVTTGAAWKYSPSEACDIRVVGSIRCDVPSNTGWRFSALVRRYSSSGALLEELTTDDRNQVASAGYGGSVSCRLDSEFSMGLGDYLQVYVIQGSGASRTLTANPKLNWISFSKIIG